MNHRPDGPGEDVLPLPVTEGASSLHGHRALVTGAGRGIGRAVAIRLATAGAAVCVSARSLDELDETAAMIAARGGQAVSIPCDITEAGAIDRLIEETVHSVGGLSLLINNAGGAHRVEPLDALSDADFELGTELNYSSVYRTMHAAAPHLFASAPQAAVVNVVSIGAARGLEGMSYYCGAKAGVVAMSRTVAREWGDRGVRVNCVGPGWITTELSRPLLENEGFASETLPRIPLSEWGTPEDVAEAVAFLSSSAARYITGTTLFVDGGLLA